MNESLFDRLSTACDFLDLVHNGLGIRPSQTP